MVRRGDGDGIRRVRRVGGFAREHAARPRPPQRGYGRCQDRRHLRLGHRESPRSAAALHASGPLGCRRWSGARGTWLHQRSDRAAAAIAATDTNVDGDERPIRWLPQRRLHEPPTRLRRHLQVRREATGLQGRSGLRSLPLVLLEAALEMGTFCVLQCFNLAFSLQRQHRAKGSQAQVSWPLVPGSVGASVTPWPVCRTWKGWACSEAATLCFLRVWVWVVRCVCLCVVVVPVLLLCCVASVDLEPLHGICWCSRG